MGKPQPGSEGVPSSRIIQLLVAAVCTIATLLSVCVSAPIARADQSGNLRIEIDDSKSVGNWNVSAPGQVVDIAVGQKVKLIAWNLDGDGLPVSNAAQWYIDNQYVELRTWNKKTGRYDTTKRDPDIGKPVGIDTDNSFIALRPGITKVTVRAGDETASAVIHVHTATMKIVRMGDNTELKPSSVTQLTAGEDMRLRYYPTFEGDGTTAQNKKYSYEFTTSKWNSPSSYQVTDADGNKVTVGARGWQVSGYNVADFNGVTETPMGEQVTLRSLISGKTVVSFNAIFVFTHSVPELGDNGKVVWRSKTAKYGDASTSTNVNISSPKVTVQYGPSTSPIQVKNGGTIGLSVGEILQLNYTIAPLHPNYATQHAAHWDSSNKQVATLDSDSSRKLTAIDKGNTTISVSIGGVIFTFTVAVAEPKLTLTYQGDLPKPVDTTNKTMELTAGESAALTLGYAPRHDYASLNSMSWTSSDINIVSVNGSSSVSSANNLPKTTMTAKKTGTVTITGTIAGRTVKVPVKVVAPTLDILRDRGLSTSSSDDNGKTYITGHGIEATVGESFKLYTQIAPAHDYASFPSSVKRTTWTEDSHGNTVSMQTSGDSTTVQAVSARGKKTTTAKITAQAGGATSSVTVTVVKPTIKITTTDSSSKTGTKDVTGKSVGLDRDRSMQFTAEVTPLHPDYARMSTNGITWASGSPSIASISRNSGATTTVEGNAKGSALIEATLDGATSHVTVNVTVPIKSVADPETVNTRVGVKPNLPITVRTTWEDGRVTDEKVTWNAIQSSQYAKTGSFTVYGKVAGYSRDIRVTVKVQGPSSIQEPQVSTNEGVAPKLPATVKVTWYDGSTSNEKVTWNKVPASQYANGGATFTVQGKLTQYGNQVTAKVTVKSTTVTMYRLYNRYTGEHFYTSSAKERDSLVKVGWRSEGTGWVAPKSGAPVYRLYNPYVAGGDHHYTMSTKERDTLVKAGWRSEGVGWYSGGSVKVLREYNPYARTGTHNYTTDVKEDTALVKAGWRAEGTGWYAVKAK
ncbi:Membrane-bound lytic murein transglycosylase D precursor [Bifidobacterium thermophilum]|uniref:Membrane-bound lytic murein transglycosylase D n=1 Tax=Bifidobacterium thermophilum TaxID=33905 RepID=A0A2N3QN42_9BIFI|nr:Ig-like domain-containing protein [Bifidobacterium thermophilum]PKU93108.1 Membrane-bound lytic murein transglycosylase D precursor [Bifidobacterium thermophilum]